MRALALLIVTLVCTTSLAAQAAQGFSCEMTKVGPNGYDRLPFPNGDLSSVFELPVVFQDTESGIVIGNTYRDAVTLTKTDYIQIIVEERINSGTRKVVNRQISLDTTKKQLGRFVTKSLNGLDETSLELNLPYTSEYDLRIVCNYQF